LRDVDDTLFQTVRAKLARFQQDYGEAIQTARPALPSALNDRAQDNWESLLAIADLGGEGWSLQARQAALSLTGKESALPSIGVELLADSQELFETHRVDRFLSTEFIRALCQDEEKPWATYNRGLPIKPRQLAVQLREFEIASQTIRIGGTTGKGYLLSQFADAFARYVSVGETQSIGEGLPSLASHSLWQRVIL
jgi:putative DNA primase/helicase